MSTVQAAAIGVGGMMGAGLHTLVGLATTTAGVRVPVSLVVGAVVSLVSVYSYARLGATFPSRGAAAHFLNTGFGDGIEARGLNVFRFLGWIIAMALYAAGFAEYAADLLPGTYPSLAVKLIAVGLIVAVVGQMASLAFLIVHGMASVGHLRVRHQTAARSGPLVAAVVLSVALFALLLEHSIRAAPASTWRVLLGALITSCAFEAVYRRRRGAPRGASQTRW